MTKSDVRPSEACSLGFTQRNDRTLIIADVNHASRIEARRAVIVKLSTFFMCGQAVLKPSRYQRPARLRTSGS